ncbi:MAG: hypothetical protein KAH97_00310 [Anaerolineales bacterium]|nr:hypothetical protein [Anaerolineales bacterium]
MKRKTGPGIEDGKQMGNVESSLRKSLRKSGDGDPIYEGVITELDNFVELICSDYSIRRWYISRIFGEDGKGQYVDLFFSNMTQEGIKEFEGKSKNEIKEIKYDNPLWWEDEQYDLQVHLSLSDFKKFLKEYSIYEESQPLDEGMVYLQIREADEPHFVPYSYQAREWNRRLYREIIGSEAAAPDETDEGDDGPVNAVSGDDDPEPIITPGDLTSDVLLKG